MLLVDHLAKRLLNVKVISSGITRRWKAFPLSLGNLTQVIEMTDRNQEGDILWNNPRQPNQTHFTEMILETSVRGIRLIPIECIKTMIEYLEDRITPRPPTTGQGLNLRGIVNHWSITITTIRNLSTAINENLRTAIDHGASAANETIREGGPRKSAEKEIILGAGQRNLTTIETIQWVDLRNSMVKGTTRGDGPRKIATIETIQKGGLRRAASVMTDMST